MAYLKFTYIYINIEVIFHMAMLVYRRVTIFSLIFPWEKTPRFELQVGWKHGALIQRLESQRKAAGGRGPRLES